MIYLLEIRAETPIRLLVFENLQSFTKTPVEGLIIYLVKGRFLDNIIQRRR